MPPEASPKPLWFARLERREMVADFTGGALSWMAWCEKARGDYLVGLAKCGRLSARIGDDMAHGAREARAAGRTGRYASGSASPRSGPRRSFPAGWPA